MATDPPAVFRTHCRAGFGETCTDDAGAGCAPHADRTRSARIRDVRTEVQPAQVQNFRSPADKLEEAQPKAASSQRSAAAGCRLLKA